MIILESEQGSEDWLRDKLNVVSGTRIKDIITAVKMDLSKSSDDLILKLIDEKITGLPASESFGNKHTDRGNEFEPMARREYTKKTSIEIMEYGLCLREDNRMHGLSPDGFTPNLKGGVEIKCPAGLKYLKYIDPTYKDSIFKDYKQQCLNYFLVNDKLEWLDTVAYRPEFYPKPIHIERIWREDVQGDLNKVQSALDQFFDNYNIKFNELTF